MEDPRPGNGRPSASNSGGTPAPRPPAPHKPPRLTLAALAAVVEAQRGEIDASFRQGSSEGPYEYRYANYVFSLT